MNGGFGRWLVPGPVEVRPEILDALRRPMLAHRGPAMRRLLERLDLPLRHLFGTIRPVALAASSGTGFMELAVRNGVRRRMLAVVTGHFGERFARIGEACGKEVVRAVVPDGAVLDPSHLARFLDGPPVDAVTLVHCETATGALAPLGELADVVRGRPDVLLLVDAVSSAGGVPIETDAWGLDLVCTASQKALGLPPGLALATVSSRLLARAAELDSRGWYFDWLRYDAASSDGLPAQTPPIPLLHALAAQLDRVAADGGWAERWRRHRRMRELVDDWVSSHPEWSLLAEPAHRSPTVSALRVPLGQSAPRLVAALAAEGWQLATGIGPGAANVIRIGHMGDAEEGKLGALLGRLAELGTARV